MRMNKMASGPKISQTTTAYSRLNDELENITTGGIRVPTTRIDNKREPTHLLVSLCSGVSFESANLKESLQVQDDHVQTVNALKKPEAKSWCPAKLTEPSASPQLGVVPHALPVGWDGSQKHPHRVTPCVQSWYPPEGPEK